MIEAADAQATHHSRVIIRRLAVVMMLRVLRSQGHVNFFIDCDPVKLEPLWLVFTVWAAAGWLTIGDDLVAEGYFPDDQRELGGVRRFRPLADLVGSTLTDIRLDHDIAELTFRDTSDLLVLRLRRDFSNLPVHHGSKQPKRLARSQDVRDAVVISRRASLWVGD